MIHLAIGTGPIGPLRITDCGIVVNRGIPDQPLPQTLLAFAKALYKLGRGEGSQAIELARGDLLWLVDAHEGEAVLRWFYRGSPHAKLFAEAHLEWRDLAGAVAAALGPIARTAQLRSAFARPTAPPRPPPSLPGFKISASLGPLELRVALDHLPAPHGTAWRTLLAPGSVELRDSRGTLASLEAPFLNLAEALHWAERAAHPGRHAEPLAFAAGGKLSLRGDDVVLDRHVWPSLRLPLIGAIGELALGFVEAFASRVPSLARHALVRAMGEDASSLLRFANQKTITPKAGADPPRHPRRKRAAKPLVPGSIRKLSFELQFRARLPFVAEKLHIRGERVLALGENDAALLSIADGKMRWHRRARAACHANTILATESSETHDWLMRLDLATGQVRWFRESEGADPLALLPGGQGSVILQEPDALSARCTETGFARWRFRPPMNEQVFVSVARDRVWACTSVGQLASLDIETGEPFFRAQAGRSFRAAPLLLERALWLTLQGDSSDALLAIDARTAQAQFTLPLGIREAGPLATFGKEVACVGRTGEGWALARIDTLRHKVTLLPLGVSCSRAPTLCATETGFLAGSDDGRFVLIERGAIAFTESKAHNACARPVQPILRNLLALLPSERCALYDLRGGRKLAQLPKLEGLCAMQADSQLRVVLADDAGNLCAYRLRGHLAVV